MATTHLTELCKLAALRKGTLTLFEYSAVHISSFFKAIDILKICSCYFLIMSVWMWEAHCWDPRRWEASEPSGAGVISDHESPSVGAENRTQIDPLQEQCVFSTIKTSPQPCPAIDISRQLLWFKNYFPNSFSWTRLYPPENIVFSAQRNQSGALRGQPTRFSWNAHPNSAMFYKIYKPLTQWMLPKAFQ